jgi:hypothetical protein
MKKNSNKSYLSILLLLFSFLLIPLNTFAQSQNAAEVIQRYENGQIIKPTQEEKAILRSYLNERMQQSSPVESKQYSDMMLATFINENFATATGTTPPSGWVQNIIAGDPSFDLWVFNNPGGRTLNAPIAAPAAIFDSDWNSFGGGAENVALESPTFSVPAAATVFLEWDQYFQGGFGGEANVEVFNGTSWVNVYTTTLTTPNPDFQSINISTHVAGIANAQVRFRWVGDWSWYWIVDNVKVFSVATGLTGIKTIPGDFATIKAAVDSLNQVGVGNGGVTFNVAAGYTELLTGPIQLTASGGPLDQIIFQKSGAGANPLITAYVGAQTPGSATHDDMWRLVGSDWVTIDGIDLYDPNATNPASMEGGYVLYKASITDGASYNTIKNCVITLNRVNNATGGGPSVEGSRGIEVTNALPTAATTAVTPTSPAGTNSYNKFYSNTIQNCNYGIVLSGYAAVSPFDLGDTGNDIGGNSAPTGNTIINFGGGSGATNPSAGVRANNQWGINISYNTINNNDGLGVNHPVVLRGIYGQAGTSANATITYNNITIHGGGTTSQVTGIENVIGTTAAGNTVNINNNTITGDYLTATTGVFYGIFNSASAATVNINNNNVSNLSYSTLALAGSGVNYPIYNSGAATNVNITFNTVSNITRFGTTGGTTIGIYVSSGSNQTVTNNLVTNMSIDGTGATSTMYGIQTSTGTIIVNNNEISNLSCLKTTGTGVLYGIYNIASPTNENYNYNQIYNLTHAGTGVVYGLYAFTTTGVRTVSYNEIYNITGAGTTIAGINMASSSPSVFNNKLWNIQSTSTGAPIVSGILLGSLGTSGVANIYNNLIGDLKAPSATTSAVTAPTVRGINITTTTTTSTINASYNTIFLNASTTGTAFGTAGLYATTSTTATTATLNLRNNIIVNTSTPLGIGFTVAYQRSSNALNNYGTISNNNDFYAGIPGASNLIFYDGTNAIQTIASYKAFVTPMDAASFTENPNFLSTVGTNANFLHIDPTIATQLESGGIPIAGITTDFDGDTRNVTSPDVGADEFSGIPLDLTPPIISYTPLANTGSTSNRTLNATITDPSGVPTAGIGLPVLYWKINYNGTWTAATAGSPSGSVYPFTFGAGVVIGDTVYYYVVAQDNATPPNVGAFPSGGAGGFTANPPYAAIPPTNPSKYIITNTPLAGNYTVGLLAFNTITGKNIYFEKSVSKVMKEVEVPVPVETPKYEKGQEPQSSSTEISFKPQTIKQIMEVEEITWIPMENGIPYEGDLFVKKVNDPSLDYPLGSDGVYATITAAVADLNLRGVSAPVNFLLTDATYPTETYPLTIDVTNEAIPTSVNTVTFKPNTGVTVTVSGASAAAQIFKIFNSYITLDGSNSGGTTRDWTIENTSTTTPQVILVGSRGTTPITNVTVKNCIIINGINTSSALVVSDGIAPGTAGWFNNITIQNNSIQKAYIGNYNISVMSPGNGSGLLITGNDFNTAGANSIALVGVYAQGIDGATISNNNIGNYTTTQTANVTGIWLATGTVNSTISNNMIGPIDITTTAPRGIVVTSGVTNSNVTVSGNTVDNMITTSTTQSYGIWVFSTTTGVMIEKNKVSNIKNNNTGGYGARGIHISTGVASTNITIKNNFVWSVQATSDAAVTYWGIGIGIEGATTGVNVWHNSVHLYGSLAGYASGSGTIHTAFGMITSTAAGLDVRDNIFVNSFDNTNQTTDKSYAINSQAPNTAFTDIDYNDYYVSGDPGVLGFLGADQTTLSAWQTATGDDANSLNVDPKFVSNTDLHINTAYNNVGDKGIFIPSVTTDIDGDTRSVTTPDIGADEYIFVPPSVLDPTNVSATAISDSQIDVAFTPNANNNNVVIVFNLTGTFTPPVGPPPAPGDPFAGGTFLTSTLTSPYSHTGLEQNTHYYYKLFSYDGVDYSPGVTADATTLTLPMGGDYTVGLNMFRQFSGLDITFEQRVRRIEVTETIVNQEAAEKIGIYEETLEGTVTLQEPAEEAELVPVTVTRTIEQVYFVPMLNGSEYDGTLYYEFTPEQKLAYKLESRGVYATITEAVNDVVVRGVSAAVRFLLVDATYPSETFPIVFGDITGASAVNTVTVLPNTGVTTTITGSIALPIFDLNNSSYIIIDGRQNGVGTTNSLTITNTSTAANAGCIRFINGATYNAVRFLNLIAQPSTSTTRAIELSTSASAPSGNSNNLISNCDVNSGRYCIYFNGTLANPNMDNVIMNSKFYDGTFAQFYMVSNAGNTTIVNNEFFNVVPQTTANSAISMSASALLGVNNMIGNKFYNLQNTSTSTLRGITGIPGAGSTLNIINNFFSFTDDNGTKTSIYAIQISGTTEHTANIHYNTFNFAGVHTGGSAGVIVSGGLIKSSTGATAVFNAKNNIGKNTRTGGTSGVIHTNFFAGSTNLVGTLDINYNVWFASGDPGSYHAGWAGFVYNDITAYRAAAAPHEQQTIFKNVDFVSGVDLHLAGLSIGDADLAGLPIAGITTDIDGDLRDLTYPYRGADEADVKFLPVLTPSNLVAIPDTFTVELSWQDNSNNEAGFIIQRKDGDSLSVNPFATIDTVGTNVIYYLNTGLNPNTTYTWRVFAYNALGASGFSNMAEATTFIPVELTAFTAEVSGREVHIDWTTATELNNRGFDIERKMDGEWEKIGFKDGKGTTTEESFYSFIDKFTYQSFVGTITYRLKQMDFDGSFAYSYEVEVDVDFTPKEYTLYQNYPNPFNPVTTIKYSLPFESKVRIAVYNVLGEMVGVMVDEVKEVGFHDFNWNASNRASGIYIYTIEAKSVSGDKSFSSVKKMILLK